MDVEATLKDALDHHRNGRPVDAHRLYKRVLADHPDEPDALHLLGMLTFENGNPAAAADLIRRAIGVRPNVVDYHLNLGRVLRADRQADAAVAALRTAVEMNPLTTAGVYRELAEGLIAAGRPAEAVGPMEAAVELAPTAESLALLGELLAVAGRMPDAYRAVLRAVQLRPDWAAAHAVLASIQDRQGDLAPAEASYRRALDLNPAAADVCNNLGSVVLRQGRPAEAVDLLRRAVQLRPQFPQAHNNLGRALAVLDRPDDAAASFAAAVAQAPKFPEAWDGLGRVRLAQRRWADAADALGRAVDQHPTADACRDLATARGAIDDMDGTLEALQQAARLDPASAETFHRLGTALRWSGQVAAALAAFDRAVALDPAHAAAAAGRAYTLLFDDATPAADAFAAHAEWGRRFADPVDPLPPVPNDHGLVDALLSTGFTPAEDVAFAEAGRQSLAPSRLLPRAAKAQATADPFARTGETAPTEPRRRSAEGPDAPPSGSPETAPRPLRVGYVSNQFRDSAVMAFIAPVLAHHDPAAVTIVCYSDTPAPDAVTAAARRSVSLWRRTATLSDAQLAQQIRDDRIDVLVELTGHLGGGRLLALARRPAPVQVSYLGYQGTTGVAAVDHVLTDAVADPPGAELSYVERPWRLPGPFFCWQPPPDAPPVGPPPSLAAGHVTFGCLNAVAKATPAAVNLWARVMAAVPDSRLTMLTTRCVATDARLRAGFAAAGVSPTRVRFVARAPRPEYLARYATIDVALDPVPFVGHTTTLDAAWMGVPTVTRTGDCYAHRYGSAALSAMGLSALATGSDDAYVRAAVTLSTDAPRLSHVRATLRQAMSPLTDAAAFTRTLEAAYRGMWAARR